ncbi:MAG: hypothetical protein GY723_23710 [bacterium]|nr:hypothetical protein [bacterium]
MNTWSLWASPVFALVLCCLFLFSPAPGPDDFVCGTYHHFGRIGVMQNCDSAHFVKLAFEPSRLFDVQEKRQSRPLYVIATSMVAQPFWLLPRLVNAEAITFFRAGYLGLVLFNFLLLGLAIHLGNLTLRQHGIGVGWIALFTVITACNDVTKAFVWTPHQQIFNLFVPLVAIFVLDRLLGRPVRPLSWRLASLGLGFGSLAYGAFLGVLPCLLGARFLQIGRQGPWFREGLTMLLLSVAPILTWMGLVRLVSGSFFSSEITDYRQFVWILDAAGEGLPELLAGVERATVGFGRTAASWEIAPFLAVAGIGIALLSIPGSKPKPPHSNMPWVCGGVLASLVLFLAAMGYSQVRLSTSLVPPAVLMAAWAWSGLLRDRPVLRRPATLCGVLFAIGWIAVHLSKSGPYS